MCSFKNILRAIAFEISVCDCTGLIDYCLTGDDMYGHSTRGEEGNQSEESSEGFGGPYNQEHRDDSDDEDEPLLSKSSERDGNSDFEASYYYK